MLDYNMVHMITSPVYVFAIYKLMKTFFQGEALNKKTEFISFFAYFFTTSFLIFLTRAPLVLLIVNIAFIFLISLNYKERLANRILYTIFIYSILVVIELVMYNGFGYYEILIFEDNTFTSIVGLILTRTTTMVLAYLIHKYKAVAKKDYSIPKTYYLGILVILFGTLYLFINSLDNNDLTMIKVIASGIILMTVNTTLMFIDEKIYQALTLVTEQKILKIQNEAYQNQAKIGTEANLAIRSIKHDMKDHLTTLNELFKNGNSIEFSQYISTIYGNLESKNLSNSNNFIVDSIINLKLQKLVDTDVYVQLDIHIEPNINILAYDLTIILGNLLENAVAAVLCSQEKKLVISINQSMGNLVILIDNSYDGILVKEGNRLKTIKKSNIDHGFGLDNVQKSLLKYEGELRISHTDKTFSVAVLIPYK